MTTIVTEFGKFKYNLLPMGMCALEDIFQDKVDKLFGDIKGVKISINCILILSNDSFEKSHRSAENNIRKTNAAGLKVNAPKCSFGLKEIPYLCYVITREVIKPDPKKVQGIMDIRRPATTIEA